jgi:hypothetical protein
VVYVSMAGRRSSRTSAGGSGVCEHGRQNYWDCGGAVYVNSRQKRICKESEQCYM